MVVADGRSVESEGIYDASWTLTYFGPDNRVATDRINEVLMSTFGDQRVVTLSDDNVDTSSVFSHRNLAPRK